MNNKFLLESVFFNLQVKKGISLSKPSFNITSKPLIGSGSLSILVIIFIICYLVLKAITKRAAAISIGIIFILLTLLFVNILNNFLEFAGISIIILALCYFFIQNKNKKARANEKIINH